ncbi:MAG: c-type cytochrome [Nitrospirae bacterium]|nr:c-type cytochrome [Nitrospirota bacterium]
MQMKQNPDGPGPTGEELFKRNCAVCHPGGGNTINPDKTLNMDHLKTHGIKKAEDIIRIMRNPGPGMRTFDEYAVPDKDAKKIAEYILKTF